MIQTLNNRPGPANKIWVGLFFITAGILLFIHISYSVLPNWLFSFPMIPVCVGIIIGIQTRFRNFFWLAPLLVGVAILVDQQMPGLNLTWYFTPVILIFIGYFLIRRPSIFSKRNSNKVGTVVFGGIKKTITEKDFKGIDITCVFGGAEIDLSRADIQGNVIIDLNIIFGGAKLVVPPSWTIRSEIKPELGVIQDNRSIRNDSTDPSKVLVLNGALLGGVEINSY